MELTVHGLLFTKVLHYFLAVGASRDPEDKRFPRALGEGARSRFAPPVAPPQVCAQSIRERAWLVDCSPAFTVYQVSERSELKCGRLIVKLNHNSNFLLSSFALTPKRPRREGGHRQWLSVTDLVN